MSSALKPARRSFGLRLALLSGMISFVMSCALMAVAAWIATDAIYDSLGDALRAESSEIVALPTEAAAISAITAREALLRGRFLYLLTSSNGDRLAGSLPSDAPFVPGLSDIAWPGTPPGAGDDAHDDAFERLIAFRAPAAGGGSLIVGADGENLVEAEEAMWVAAAWGVPLAALASFVAAAAVGARYRRRVEAVAERADAIVGDQLSLRMPVSGTGDEIDRLAAALNAMLDRLTASMEGLRQISNDIAHELRSPLSRLRNSLETALTLPEPDVLERAVEEAAEEANGLLNIFAALLRIAQIEGGALLASFSKVDLSHVLTQLCEIYAPVAEDQGQQLHSSIAPGIIAQGDRELLLQMFANLIENALRHTPAGSSLNVVLDRVAGKVIVAVEDDGPGVPAEERSNVVKRFYRLDASRTTDGSGLGLALARAIAEAHGATMTLEDADPGLRVVLRFGTTPLQMPEAPPPKSPAMQ